MWNLSFNHIWKLQNFVTITIKNVPRFNLVTILLSVQSSTNIYELCQKTYLEEFWWRHITWHLFNVEKTSLTSKQTELSRSHVQKKETKNVPLVIIAFTIEWVNSFICSVICLKCWFFNQNAKFRTSNPWNFPI